MKIPDEISIAGITVKTVDQPKMLEQLGVIGGVNFHDQVIMIDKASASEDTIMQAYIHEVVHYILFVMGKMELGNDEEFVDMFAHLAYQAIKDSSCLV